jgi:hypothetical protein
MGKQNMTPAQQKWLDAYMAETGDFKRGGAAEYVAGGPLDLESLDPSQLESLSASRMEGVSTDPRYKDAQLEALRSMEVRSKQGMTAQDEADMFKLQQQVNTANRGRLGAIQNQMASRGMSGSGMDAAMQLQSSQDAGEREALAAMEKAGQIQNNKMNAAQSLGQMGGQMRGQEFGEQSAKAQAADTINRFNVANRVDRQNQNVDVRNRGRTATWDRQNQTADRNAGAGYQYRRDAMQAGQGAAEVGMNAATQDENARLLREQEKRRRKTQALSTGIGIAGGIAGGIYGGPAGAGAGYQAGSGVGTAVGNANYAFGGDVYDDFGSQNVPVPGVDSPLNDTKPAILSPGEHVVPRSAMSSEEAFNDYTNRLRESVREKQANVDSAQSDKRMADYGSIFTGALNDYNKGMRKDTILAANPFKDGSIPHVSRGEVNEVKDYAGPMAEENLARADKELAQGKADFAGNEKLKQGFKEIGRQDAAYNQDNDIDSEKAKQANLILKSVLSNKAKEADMAGDKETATQLRNQMSTLQPMSAKDALAQYSGIKELDYKDVLSNINADKRLNRQIASEDSRFERADKRETNKESQRKIELTNQLRKEVSGDDLYKKAKATDMTIAQVESLAAGPQNGATDQALIMAFNKAMDPGSVVRESEFAQTQNGGGLVSKMDAYVQQLRSGQKLTPEMRENIRNTMTAIRNGNNVFLQGHISKYNNAINSQGIDRSAIFGDETEKLSPSKQENIGSRKVTRAEDL